MQLHKLLSALFILWLSDTTAPGTVVFTYLKFLSQKIA